MSYYYCPMEEQHIYVETFEDTESNEGGAQTKSVSLHSGFRSSQCTTELGNYDVFEDEYSMHHTKRGLALVFNHYEFDIRNYRNGEQYRPSRRDGTHIDRDSLLDTFSNLGFKVEPLNDKCYKEIKNKLRDVADQDHSDHDCLAVAVLTHGEEGGQLDARDREYDARELWEPFISIKCPSLAGKPKLFFIQACRGRSRDHGFFIRNVVGDATDAAVFIPSSFQVPSYADFLISFSTFEGHVSFRHPTQGSWYVQTLCDQLRQHAGKKDLVSVLTDVNRIVGREFRSTNPYEPRLDGLVQGPCFLSSLTRPLRLRPRAAPAAADPPRPE